MQAQDTGKVYIVQRGGKVSSNKGKWQLPGGAMEEKENPYQGAARELIEETSFQEDQLKDLSHVGDVVFDNGKGWTYTNIAATIPNEVDIDVDPQESSAGQWVSIKELLDMRDSGELVPSLEKNIKNIADLFGGGDKGEEETVKVSNEDAIDISLQPATNVKGMGGKSIGHGIPSSDNGQGIVKHDNSQVSISGVPKGKMTHSPLDIQSAGMGQKLYDPIDDLEWERKDYDLWQDNNGQSYTAKEMEALAKADGFIWGSKSDFMSQAPKTIDFDEPQKSVPDKDKEYGWSEVKQLVADFYANSVLGSNDDIVK